MGRSPQDTTASEVARENPKRNEHAIQQRDSFSAF